MANFLKPWEQFEVYRLLILGWSHREVAKRIGCSNATVSNAAKRIDLRRENSHRSPRGYWHRNGTKQWWHEHEFVLPDYDRDKLEKVLIELNRAAQMQNARESLKQVQRYLKDKGLPAQSGPTTATEA